MYKSEKALRLTGFSKSVKDEWKVDFTGRVRFMSVRHLRHLNMPYSIHVLLDKLAGAIQLHVS